MRSKNNGEHHYKFESKVNPDNFEMIDVGKIVYDKKVLIIYNP